MPAIQRTNLPEIVRAARGLLDSGGPQAVTMGGVAASVGVRGPSLYKHVADRAQLMRLVVESALEELGDGVRAAASRETEPAEALASAARAFRAFAHRSPHACALVFGALSEDERPAEAANLRAVEPIFQAVAALVPEPEVLPAARMITAWANGFVTMELAGAFRSGGSVDEAFEWGLSGVIDAIVAAGRRAGAS